MAMPIGPNSNIYSTSSSNSALRRVDIGAYPKPRTIIFSLQIRY